MAPPEPQIAALDRLGESLVGSFERPRPRDPVRLALVTATVLLVVAGLVGAAFTPVGRAVTDAIGDFFGIGEDAVVIGTGEQAAFPYKVVASNDVASKPDPNRTPEPCLSVAFPDFREFVQAVCLTDAQREQLAKTSVSQPLVVGLPGELYPEAEIMVQGLAGPEVGEVDVHYTDHEGIERTVVADLSYLGGSLSRQIRIEDQTQTYVAFLPPGLLAPPSGEDAPLTAPAAREALRRMSISVLDSNGDEIGVEGVASQTAAFLLALRAPETSFADERELAERCRRSLPPTADDQDIEFCVYDAIGY